MRYSSGSTWSRKILPTSASPRRNAGIRLLSRLTSTPEPGNATGNCTSSVRVLSLPRRKRTRYVCTPPTLTTHWMSARSIAAVARTEAEPALRCKVNGVSRPPRNTNAGRLSRSATISVGSSSQRAGDALKRSPGLLHTRTLVAPRVAWAARTRGTEKRSSATGGRCGPSISSCHATAGGSGASL